MRIKRSSIPALVLLLILFLGGCTGVDHRKDLPTKVLIVPPGLENAYDHMQFSAAVKAGNTLFVSGVTGGSAGGSLEDKARNAFRTIKYVLEYAGSGLDDVVEIVTYHKNMDDFYRFFAVKSEFFKDRYPAWTAVGTTGLVDPDAEVEIKVSAVIGSGKRVHLDRGKKETHE